MKENVNILWILDIKELCVSMCVCKCECMFMHVSVCERDNAHVLLTQNSSF